MTRQEVIEELSNKYMVISPIEFSPEKSRNNEILDIAIESIEYAEKYKWHDLRENPEDIPLNNNLVLILLKGNVYDLARVTSRYWLKHEDKIIAWKEIGSSEVEE